MEESANCCRVCGYYNETPPWGDEGINPTYEICPCCGVEYGYEDYTFESIQGYREKWISNGMIWFDKEEKPENWNAQEQFNCIPEKYRKLE